MIADKEPFAWQDEYDKKIEELLWWNAHFQIRIELLEQAVLKLLKEKNERSERV